MLMDVKEDVKRTPLYQEHLKLGARLTPFAGYEMPVQYAGIIEEHLAVRHSAGLFDVSHMGEIFVRGPHAFDFVQHLVTNDAASLYDGRAMYTVMCREDGGIIDDLLVYKLSDDEYMLVVNAANRDKDWRWMIDNNPAKADFEDRSDDIGLIALQGPRSFEIAERLIGESIDDLKFYHFRALAPRAFFDSEFALVSYTGYTGERGVEIYCEAESAPAVWRALIEHGKEFDLQPAGLGARDTLRIEAGYCLYGNDITEETNPLEAGLAWLTKLDKDEFIGKAALEQVQREGIRRKLVGLVMEERGIPRSGYPILDDDGAEIGTVTSGTQSPMLQQGIGLGYVANKPAFTEAGREIQIGIRGRPTRARIKKPPFHKQ